MADEVVRQLYVVEFQTDEAGIAKIIAAGGKVKEIQDKNKQSVAELRNEVLTLAKAHASAAQATGVFDKIQQAFDQTISEGTSRFKALKTETKLYSDIAAKAGLHTPVGAQAAQLAQKAAGELRHLNSELRLITSNNAGFLLLGEASKGVTAGLEVAVGATALFGEKSETTEKVLVRLNAVMALSNGLREVYNALTSKTSLFVEARTVKEKILASLETAQLARNPALVAAEARKLAATTALTAAQTRGIVQQSVLLEVEAADVALKTAQTGSSTALTVATNVLSVAVKGLLSSFGIIAIVLGAIYLIYQSVTNSSDGFKEVLKESKKVTEENTAELNKLGSELVDLEDKFKVLNGTLSETDAAINKIGREGQSERIEALRAYQKEAERIRNTEKHDVQTILQLRKDAAANEAALLNKTRLIYKREVTEKANIQLEADKKAREDAEKAAKKAAEDRRNLNAELRRIEFERALAAIQEQEDAEILAAKGNEEKILQIKKRADTERLAEILHHGKEDIEATKAGTIERVRAEEQAGKALSAAKKELNKDDLALQVLYEKHRVELQKQYDQLLVDALPEGTQKQIAGINKRYADLIVAIKENEDSLSKAQVEAALKQAKSNQEDEIGEVNKKENSDRVKTLIETGEIIFGLQSTSFSKQRKIIKEETQLKKDAAVEDADLQNKTGEALVIAKENLNAKLAALDEEARDGQRAVTKEQVALAREIVDGLFSVANDINAAASEDFDKQISEQEKRVQAAREQADKGNAELLDAEQQRLDKLNKQKEQQADRARAIAAVQIVANAGIAISEAATIGFPQNIIAIAVTLAALAAGLAKTKGFSEGGYTGDGGKYDIAGPAHRGEFVFNQERTRPNLNVFKAIHEGRISNDRLQSLLNDNDSLVQMPMVTAQLAASSGASFTKQEWESMMSKQAKEIANYIPGSTTLNITERGLNYVVSKVTHQQEQVKRHARIGK